MLFDPKVTLESVARIHKIISGKSNEYKNEIKRAWHLLNLLDNITNDDKLSFVKYIVRFYNDYAFPSPIGIIHVDYDGYDGYVVSKLESEYVKFFSDELYVAINKENYLGIVPMLILDGLYGARSQDTEVAILTVVVRDLKMWMIAGLKYVPKKETKA